MTRKTLYHLLYNKNRYKNICLGILFVCCCLPVFSQRYYVRAKTDKNNITIGELITFNISASAPKGTKIFWPIINDSIGDKFEVIKFVSSDTALTSSTIAITQEIIISCYDSGRFSIPPLHFTLVQNKDTAELYTDSIPIQVATIAVKEGAGIKDITSPVEMPYSYMEILPFIIIVLGVIIAGLVSYILIIRWIRKRKAAIKPVEIVVEIPDPFKVAIDQLEILDKKMLWQSGLVKEFHIELTDILRQYLEDRFGIDAKEMVSREIIHAIQALDTEAEMIRYVERALRLADLVKFAKGMPTAEENSWSFHAIRSFIESTHQPSTEK